MVQSDSINTSDDADARLAEAVAILEQRGIAATAREFRLRQEFTRYGWDMRVRHDQGAWNVTAEKAGRDRVAERGATEADALRFALVSALRADDAVAAE